MSELDTFSITVQEILPLRGQIAAISFSSNLTLNKTITLVRKIGRKSRKLSLKSKTFGMRWQRK